MGFDQLKENVQKKADVEKKRLISDAEKKAEAIKKESREECEKLENDMRQEVTETTEHLMNQARASAKLEVKKRALAVRKEMIEKAFSTTREEIGNKLAKKDREKVIKGLMKEAEKQLKIATVYCNKTDAAFIKGYSTQEADIIGGVIAEDKEGNYRVDLSFESLLDQIKEDHLSKINESLFA